MNWISILRQSGRSLAVLVVFLLAIDTLTAGFGHWDLTFLKPLYGAHYFLPLLVVTGTLGLTYTFHRERTGSNIALCCGVLFTAMAVLSAQNLRVWSVGVALALPSVLLILALEMEKRAGGGQSPSA